MPLLKHKACWLALVLASCSEASHPPYAVDGAGNPQDRATDPSSGDGLITGSDEETAGRCGLVNVELEVLRPNFFFLLDSSDSMEELMPDSGGISRHLAARQAILDMLRVSGHRVNLGAAIFPDPDHREGCGAGRSVFEVRPGEPLGPDGSDNATLEALAFTLRKYSPWGATPVTASLERLGPELRELETSTRLFLLTDGAPNCASGVTRCDADRCIPNIESASFDGEVVCDETTNCCAELFPHLCLDDAGVLAELEALARDDIETYVIGIPGSEVYADVLAAMARAGGTARTDAEVEYYRVEDAEALALTLTTLGEQLSSSCEFELGTEPRDRDGVTVQLDDTSVDVDEPNGFAWTGPSSLELRGKACRAWQRGDVAMIRVFESCGGKAR